MRNVRIIIEEDYDGRKAVTECHIDPAQIEMAVDKEKYLYRLYEQTQREMDCFIESRKQ